MYIVVILCTLSGRYVIDPRLINMTMREYFYVNLKCHSNSISLIDFMYIPSHSW